MKSKLKFKQGILFGIILVNFLPNTVLASNNKINRVNNYPQISEKKININYENIKHLHENGAISTKEANKYINESSGNLQQDFITNQKNLNNEELIIKNKNELKKGRLVATESDLELTLKLINIENLKSYDISKLESGWQIIINLPEDIIIDRSKFHKKSKYFSNIKIDQLNKSLYIIKLAENSKYKINKPILNKGEKLEFKFIISPLKNKNSFKFPFFNRLKRTESPFNEQNEAKAPPLGDIAVGSVVLKNRGFIKLEGPEVSLTLNDSSAKDALMKLAKMGGYGLVLTNNEESKKNNINNSENKANAGPKVTLSFDNEDYSIAFNSILLASGLQAKRSNNLIIVGENVIGKSFGPQLSKVYRLNQSSASSAADYLASLGASISKVDTIAGASNKQGSPDSNTKSFKYIDTYSASTGPLIGLTGTTDSRLQTITLIGSSELIFIAEKYLKQLDLRQRQVALSVKILDVEFTDSDSLNNDFAFRSGSTFIVNESGKLFSAFGNFIPPKLSTTSPSQSKSVTETMTTVDGMTSTESSIAKAITTSVTPNPGFQYTANELYNFLVAQIKKSTTKVLANPTLILSENSEAIKGGAEVTGDEGLGQATIGRPYANESFVTLGTKVITDYKTSTSKEGGSTSCEASFSTAGLTFGARVFKIDDNGYVTFSLSPELTSISEIINIPGCGAINILSVRRLDTGTLRVKDSQTLILTGVISNRDSKVVTKTPILGDIPILGRIFRSNAGSKRKGELIILVTPRILNDSVSNTSEVGFDPSNEESKNFLKNK
ncbi:type II secretion system protein GspD [Prochlorococcus sp. MIT 0801]|uniref:type II secretion system protein GspD n=1 Tax=Prochlorococcus sp. MIT 0801 TaxID=1501269 RepID=UPI0004F7A0F1|nr:hypothetical protein [Prochlorococcus sp. MIT 0801]AIQ97327.1 putative proteinral (type II) secretion pathway protein D precursor [Prochlorococcus sp. MIT 0801]